MSAGTFPLVHEGKVRDLYDAGNGQLLMVASDRISAFDVVMAEPIPDKGRILTAMSAFWFELLAPVAGNHLVSTAVDDLPAPERDPWRSAHALVGGAPWCRWSAWCGYLSGSGEGVPGRRTHLARIPRPAGGRPPPSPIFTPTTKAPVGTHDEATTFDDVVAAIGGEQAEAVRALALAAYRRGAAHAERHGIILADTKFELGWVDGDLVLADEVLTPDSSRFWPDDALQPGTAPPSFDKQPVRDELEASGWAKSPPPPALSAATVTATRSATSRPTSGCRALLADWPGSGGP